MVLELSYTHLVVVEHVKNIMPRKTKYQNLSIVNNDTNVSYNINSFLGNSYLAFRFSSEPN